MILGIDTCGPSGSVALGRFERGLAEIVGQRELAGRTYSATLVAAVDDLLKKSGTQLRQLDAIVIVNGPGSFTGVRVGLSAVKGFAEGAQIPVLAVSRLEVLAAKAGCLSSALDAHRGEVFLRTARHGRGAKEILVGRNELMLTPQPGPVAVCDDLAAALLAAMWPDVKLLHLEAPSAVDALRHCAPRVALGEFVDLALLDGHYLRRSDAEIFGPETVGAGAVSGSKGA
jgi:tRNA threonylcarbamoyladenosine biosynthesis protein TsaB